MSKGKEITQVERHEVERASQRPAVAPPVDIYENNDEVLVIADVPGVSPNGLHLNFENNKLTIDATAKLKEIDGTPLFGEFSDVDYRRTFQLAPGIEAENITAEIRNGSLHIHLPKAAALKPRQIPVTTG